MKTLMMVLLVVLCVGATVAQGQIVNPTSVEFDHSGYATASAYFGGYFALLVLPTNNCDLVTAPAVAPAVTDNLGKPATTTGLAMSALLQARPIGCYVMKVRVLDVSGLFSDWSVPSDAFMRRPASPSKPVVR